MSSWCHETSNKTEQSRRSARITRWTKSREARALLANLHVNHRVGVGGRDMLISRRNVQAIVEMQQSNCQYQGATFFVLLWSLLLVVMLTIHGHVTGEGFLALNCD